MCPLARGMRVRETNLRGRGRGRDDCGRREAGPAARCVSNYTSRDSSVDKACSTGNGDGRNCFGAVPLNLQNFEVQGENHPVACHRTLFSIGYVYNSLLQFCWKELETASLAKEFVQPPLASMISTSTPAFLVVPFDDDLRDTNNGIRPGEKHVFLSHSGGNKVPSEGKVGSQEVSPELCRDQRWVLRLASLRKVSKRT